MIFILSREMMECCGFWDDFGPTVDAVATMPNANCNLMNCFQTVGFFFFFLKNKNKNGIMFQNVVTASVQSIMLMVCSTSHMSIPFEGIHYVSASMFPFIPSITIEMHFIGK